MYHLPAHQLKKGPQKLQKKLFSYFLFVPTIVLIVFTVFFYLYTSGILISREQSTLKTLVDTTQSQVDARLKDLNSVSSNINYYNRKTAFLPEQLTEDLNTPSGKNIVNQLQTLNGLDVKADQINLYDKSGNCIEVGMITKNIACDPQMLPPGPTADSSYNSWSISYPYQTQKYSSRTKYGEWYVSLTRPLLDSHSQPSGTIETVKRCKILFQSIIRYERITEDPAQVMIFAEDGTLIYPYEEKNASSSRCGDYYQWLKGLQAGNGKALDPISQSPIRYVTTSSSFSGWTYLTMQKDSVILRPVYQMIAILCLIIILLFLASILLSYLLSRSLVRPVKHLKHVIQRMRLANLDEENITDYTVPYKELDELYRQFQEMRDSLRDSLEKLDMTQKLELQSRVIALQSQMNPHFYYNTLSCINILAENGKSEEVATMCQKLSAIMRYITSTTNTMVTLREEMDYVQEYLYCIGIRYQDSLTYTLNLEEELANYRIPKLIIQPLVENAIKYGTDCLPPWQLHVTSYHDAEKWYIEVTDSGKGFPLTTLDHLKAKLADVSTHMDRQLTDLKIGGLGLINVYIRWRIMCEDSILFDFGNTDDGHAFVRIGRFIFKGKNNASISESEAPKESSEDTV